MKNKKNGFTMLELIIASSISSIVICLAAFSLTSIERYKLKQAAITLQTNIRYCQRNAVEEKKAFRISFDTDGYYIPRTDDKGDLKSDYVKLPNGIKFDPTPSGINYTINGTVNQGCTVVLSGKIYSLDITLNPGCGRVEIKQIKKLVK